MHGITLCNMKKLKYFFIALPLLIGFIGYYCLGGLSPFDAFYASLVLYFANPVSDI